MDNAQKSTSTAAPGMPERGEAELPFATAYAALLHRAFERYATIHKASMDAFTQQSLDVIGTLKNSVKGTPAVAPVLSAMEVTAQAFESAAGMHKSLIDMAVQQSAAIVEATRERGASMSRFAGDMTDLWRQAGERSVAAQKMFIDFAAQQNKVITETVKKQFEFAGPPAAAAAESIQKGMDAVLDTQKELLDIAAKPMRTAAKSA